MGGDIVRNFARESQAWRNLLVHRYLPLCSNVPFLTACIYLSIFLRIHLYVSFFLRRSIYVPTCLCIYLSMFTHNICTHIYIDAYMHTHIRAYILTDACLHTHHGYMCIRKI